MFKNGMVFGFHGLEGAHRETGKRGSVEYIHGGGSFWGQ